MMRFALGVDPGVTETGVVLCDANTMTPMAWATFTSPTGHEDLARVVSMASEIVNTIADWLTFYKISRLDIGIETPIFNKKNPKRFALQIRLLQEIESGVFHVVAGELVECWVTEVNPKQAKMLAANHGDATKDEMVAASPFEYSKPRKRPTRETVQALADAWAQATATWGTLKRAPRMNYGAVTAAPVECRYTGSK